MTYVRWSIWIMLIFIGFRSQVTSQWHFEKGNQIKTRCRVCLTYAMWWVISRHRENDRYWRVVGMQAVDINYYKLAEICLHAKIDAFVTDLLGMRAVERGYPRPLVGRQFYRLCLRGLCYRDKDASGASRDFGAVYQASTRPSAGVDTFVQPASQNQDYRTARR